MDHISYFKTTIGWIKIHEESDKLSSLKFVEKPHSNTRTNLSTLSKKIILDLKGYFDTGVLNIDLPLPITGTAFQKQIWELVKEIPKGKTMTYKQLALRYGNLKSIRAVANAVGKNPIMLYIPCHRVIGSDGSMTGYAGGIKNKKWLLEHEGASIQKTLNL